jgi:hypothetical protein
MKERWESREKMGDGREMGEREMEEVEREMGTFHLIS